MKLNSIENIVKEILTDNVIARGDDFVLIAATYSKLNDGMANLPFSYVMVNHEEFHLPAPESITRVRRKLQNKYENLKPSKRIEKMRAENEKEFREYAKM